MDGGAGDDRADRWRAQWDNAKTALAMRAGILLRLHVVANSDDAEDQRVKLCVRDAVQDAYQARAAQGEPMLKQAQEMLPELQMAAEKAARQEGFDGSVTATIENIAFDARELDGLTIPAGIYPALMVRLGDAQGHNWWGLLDRDAALSAAEVNAPGLCIWTSGGVQWTLSLPALFAQWFLGGNRMSRRSRGLALLALMLCCMTLSASAAVVAWGSRGAQVTLIQQKLKQYGYFDGTVDGVFGRDTYNAVVWFQKKNGLTADGAVGPSTAAALGVSLSGGTVAASSYQESEIRVLARLVNGEARGEPYIGQVAVAAVVLNRVKSSAFPNTISGVVFQTGAFDAVWDGQFDLEPTANAIRAARDAMNGWDPTGGCLYYYNPATATNSWIWTRQVQLSIGNARAFAI